MKKIGLLYFIFASSSFALAQNEDDALRYSFTTFGGSARNASTAGSFGAIGGDYSVVSSNPAGLARFKKHNFSFAQVVEVPVVTTDFYGTETKTVDPAYKIANASYIKAYNLDPTKFNNWYGVQLGLGYNRIHSFHEEINYSGGVDSSILHSFIRAANGTSTANIYDAFPFDAGLAYDTYALDPGPDNTYITSATGPVSHSRSINRKGGMGEYSLTMSGNYANKVFIGGTLNFTRIKYSEKYEHKEIFSSADSWVRDIRYLYDLSVDGWGVGARAGAIFLPVDWVRIGISVQTPTIMSLSDQWTANMFTNTKDGLKYVADENIPHGSYNYRITTPMRANTSIGLVFKKRAALGIDLEYVDYTMASLSSKKYSEAPYYFIAENTQVENIYRSGMNLKTGLEYRVTGEFYLRGGYAYYSSPFKADKGNLQVPTQFITGGIGYNAGLWYMDLAVVSKYSQSRYYAYDPTMQGSQVGIQNSNLAVNITAGIRID